MCESQCIYKIAKLSTLITISFVAKCGWSSYSNAGVQADNVSADDSINVMESRPNEFPFMVGNTKNKIIICPKYFIYYFFIKYLLFKSKLDILLVNQNGLLMCNEPVFYKMLRHSYLCPPKILD